MQNIYFSDEAWAVLQQPIFEDGKQLKTSAKVNRAVLSKLTKLKSETQVEVEGLRFNLKKLSKGLTILKCLSEPSLEPRFNNYIQLIETIVSSLENRVENTP